LKENVQFQSNAQRLVTVFCILVLIFCFVYFFELASFPFSLDEEWAALRKNPSIWIAQGRWGSFLIEKYLLPQSALPFVPQMIFGFACAASFLMIMRMLGRNVLALSLADYASFVIFCAFPTWFFIVEFSSNIGAVGLGLLSATAAVSVATTASGQSWRDPRLLLPLIGAGLLGAFSIATYQTLLFYMFSLCAGVILFNAIHRKDQIGRGIVIRMAVTLAGAAAFYFLISSAFKWYFVVEESYTNIFFNTGYFLRNPIAALLKTAEEMAAFYGLSDAFYHSPVWAFPVLLVTGAASLVLDGKHGLLARLVLLAVGAALVAAPFALNPFYPVHVLGRTMVAVAIAAWFMTYLGLSSHRKAVRLLAQAALVVAIAQIVFLQNKNQASSYFLAKHDLLVATSIYERLGNAPGFRKGARYPMAVFGGRNFRSAYDVPWSSNAAASFFGPFLNNNFRVRAYLRMLGLEGLRPMNDNEMDGVIVRLSQMPIWPEAGSVVLENDVLLVRLAREPGPSEAASLARVSAKTQGGASP